MNCKLCQSSNVKHLFDLDGKHPVYACPDCNLQFMHPQLSDEEITELYSESYYKSWGISGDNENKSSRQMKIDTFMLRLDLIKKYKPAGKVLDVGCATGYFLEGAAQRGYEPYGIELSAYSSNLAKKKFGVDNIFNGTLETSEFKPGMFDIITMFDLIEHVRIPRQTILKAKNLLAKDGIIVITTPDNKSLSQKIMGQKWTHYKKEHFYYFDFRSLCLLAEQCEMELIYSENSKKALNINYLHTQLNVYRHWLLTPFINALYSILPKRMSSNNFHIGIGEITVVFKNKIQRP